MKTATIGTKYMNEKDKEYFINFLKSKNILYEIYMSDVIIKQPKKLNKVLPSDNLLKMILGTKRIQRDKK